MKFTTATIAALCLISASPIVANDPPISASASGAIRHQRRLASKSSRSKINRIAETESLQGEGAAAVLAAKVKKEKAAAKAKGYEVWGSDQSNSVPGASGAGVKGSFLWIWVAESISDQLNGEADATPLSCTPNNTEGPCDLLDIFPQDLMEVGTDAPLSNLTGFGRLHGVIKDPSSLYVTANIFTPAGGYIGIIDTETKEAIALFRVTATTGNSKSRSVHMSTWSSDGSAIIVDNLHGKMIERIDVTRDKKGKITDLVFNKSAGIYLGTGFSLVAEATAFYGQNAFGNDLIGSVAGDYANAGKLFVSVGFETCISFLH